MRSATDLGSMTIEVRPNNIVFLDARGVDGIASAMAADTQMPMVRLHSSDFPGHSIPLVRIYSMRELARALGEVLGLTWAAERFA
jgi:hypothetical protein